MMYCQKDHEVGSAHYARNLVIGVAASITMDHIHRRNGRLNVGVKRVNKACIRELYPDCLYAVAPRL